jgi:hypothetical protein
MILTIVVYVLPILSIAAALIALNATVSYVVTLVRSRRAADKPPKMSANT